MNRDMLETLVLEQLADYIIEKNNYVLTEEQQNWVNEALEPLLEAVWNAEEREAEIKRQMENGASREEAEKNVAEAEAQVEKEFPEGQVPPPDTPRGRKIMDKLADTAKKAFKRSGGAQSGGKNVPKDDTPGKLDPGEKKEAGKAKNAVMQTLKQKGIIGAAGSAVAGAANKVFTTLFGSGVYNRAEDAQDLIQLVRRGENPARMARDMYKALYRLNLPNWGTMYPPIPGGANPRPDGGGEEGGEGDADGTAGNQGADFPVPVFKKFSGADQEKGAHPRSLSSQLMKLFPNVPKSAITQILKGVSAQLKANDVAIQENRYIIAKTLIENLDILNEEGDFLKPSVIKSYLKKLRKKMAGKWSTSELLNQIRSVLKDAQPPSGLDPLRVPGGPSNLEERAETPYVVRLQDLHKAIMNVKLVGEDGKLSNEKIDPDDAWKIAQEFATWLEEGQKGANISVDRGQEDPEEKPEEPGEESEEAGEEAAPEAAPVGDDLFDRFKEMLKRLDLHTSEGREAAKNTEAAYLGAYKFYKAMKLALPAVRSGKLDVKKDRIEKLLTPLNEVEGENEHAAGKEFSTWLANMINIFDQAGLNDSERAMKASKAARGASDPKEKGYAPAKVKAAAGSINTRQSVGPQLKAAGIDLKSPEGQALQKKMLKVIRRFLNKNMQRMGKQDIKIISEEMIKEMKKRGIIT